MVDSITRNNDVKPASLPDSLNPSRLAASPPLPATPSITARVSGVEAMRLGTSAGATPQEALRWGQNQGPVQLTQVQQERLAPLAAQANAPTPPDAATLARLSNDVYSDRAVPPAGFRTASVADLNRLGLRQADLEPTNSAFRARVYATGAGAETQYVVAFRGSTTDARDWVSNGQQAAGLPSDHYSRALAIGRALARNDDVPVTLTGHSLGGGLASAAAIASGQDATTFNAAGLSQNTINQANTIRTGANASGVAQVSAYYVRGEILTVLQEGGDRVLGGILGRFAGSAVGGPLGGVAGAQFGRAYADAPSAYGNRIALEPVRPSDLAWYQDFPVLTSFNRHGMNYVLSSIGAR